MANLRRRKPQETESLFVENHEPFFNTIGQGRLKSHIRDESANLPRVTFPEEKPVETQAQVDERVSKSAQLGRLNFAARDVLAPVGRVSALLRA
jgi:hypothetical protein